MVINRITVDGYANIKRTKIDFQDIVALVALNSYGKTNMLRAIDFGIQFIKKNDNFTGNASDSTPGLPLNINEYRKDFYFCIEGTSVWNGKPVNVKYEYQFQWGTESIEGYIKHEKLSIRDSGTRAQYKDYIIRDDQNAYRRSSPSGRCDYEIKVKPIELTVYKLKSFDELFFHDVIDDLLNVSFVLVRHLDPRYAYARRLYKVMGETDSVDLEKISEDLSYALFLLQRDYPDKYILLSNTFLMLFPNIDKIEVFTSEFKSVSELESMYDGNIQKPDKEYRLYVYEKNVQKPIRCELLSDGTKRMLLFLAYVIVSSISHCSVIALEEAENSIHPSLLQSFLSIVSQLAGNCKILITSHSPYLIQYLDPLKIYIGVPNDLGVAQFRRINGKCRSSLLKDAYQYGTTIGEYIFKLIGGVDEDLETLDGYLECSE